MLNHSRHTTYYRCCANYFGHIIMYDLLECHGSIVYDSVFSNHIKNPFICHRKITSHSHCLHFISCSSSKDCHRNQYVPPVQPGYRNSTLVKLFYFGSRTHFSINLCSVDLDQIMYITRASLLLCKFNNTSTSFAKHKIICCGYADFFSMKATNSCRFVRVNTVHNKKRSDFAAF